MTAAKFGADVRIEEASGFVLREASLRKLVAILQERDSGENAKPRIRLTRIDRFSFITDDIEHVLSQENGREDKVNNIEFVSNVGNEIEYIIAFSEKDGVTGRIVGENRDRVFLLYSDIRDHISRNILESSRIPALVRRISKPRIIWYPLIMLLIFITFMSLAMNSFRETVDLPKTINRLLLSMSEPSIEAKLNAILESQAAAMQRTVAFPRPLYDFCLSNSTYNFYLYSWYDNGKHVQILISYKFVFVWKTRRFLSKSN